MKLYHSATGLHDHGIKCSIFLEFFREATRDRWRLKNNKIDLKSSPGLVIT